MIAAGFDIKFEDESDSSKKHAEFVATNSAGEVIVVEAKSRHRDGVLGYKAPPRRLNSDENPRVSVEGLIRKAVAKKPDCAYFIFIDVDLPYCDKSPHGNPWLEEMAKTVEALQKEWSPDPFPANAIYFCNDLTYQESETTQKENNFWCYAVPIKNPVYRLLDDDVILRLAQSIIKRTTIPNEYPEK